MKKFLFITIIFCTVILMTGCVITSILLISSNNTKATESTTVAPSSDSSENPYFLQDLSSSDIKEIKFQYISGGEQYTITDSDTIKSLVEYFQSIDSLTSTSDSDIYAGSCSIDFITENATYYISYWNNYIQQDENTRYLIENYDEFLSSMFSIVLADMKNNDSELYYSLINDGYDQYLN